MFLGVNMFFGLSLSHFNPCLAAQAKMILSCIQNLFMPVNINFIILLITLFLHMQLILQQWIWRWTACTSVEILWDSNPKSRVHWSYRSWTSGKKCTQLYFSFSVEVLFVTWLSLNEGTISEVDQCCYLKETRDISRASLVIIEKCNELQGGKNIQ